MIGDNRLRLIRWTAIALLVAFAGAACGQKSGVARLTAAESALGRGGAVDEGVTDETAGSTEVTGDTAATGTGTTGSTTTRGATRTGTTTTGATTAVTGGREDTTGITRDEIVVGIHAPITGAARIETFSKGLGVYSHFAGRLPLVGNRKMRVIGKDDAFNTSDAIRVCTELVRGEKVFVLVGGAGADQIKVCAEYAASQGVPYLSPGVTEGGFSSLSNYFALSETYNQQNAQIVQLIKNHPDFRKTKMCVILTDSPLLNETLTNIRNLASNNGITIVYDGRIRKDAVQNETDIHAQQCEDRGAEVVYALISPQVFAFFISSARTQAYFPIYTGPGLSNGINLVANLICAQQPAPKVYYLSPMVQMDKIDQFDRDYQTAYRAKPGNSAADRPDDIGILLWGLEKTLRLMFDATGATISRQSLIRTLESNRPFASNVYAPVRYAAKPHFGANQTTLLKLDCTGGTGGWYVTEAAFASSF